MSTSRDDGRNAHANMYTDRILASLQPFIIGGASGLIATTCIHPIDVVKVRLQLDGQSGRTNPRPGALGTVKNIISGGRVLDLYQGISAGYLRQVVYGTARLGLFYTFEGAMKQRARSQGREVTFAERGLAGLLAGGLGSMVGNPTEVALVRMQSDGAKPPAERANYRSVFDTLARVIRADGIRGLWSGVAPTVMRACATNVGQLTFFSESKHQLSQHTQLTPQMQSLVASGIAGAAASVLSLPFDFVKTRMQWQSKHSKDGVPPYRGFLDCGLKVARTEGLSAFYRGFVPYLFRIAPHTMIMLTVSDFFYRLWARQQ